MFRRLLKATARRPEGDWNERDMGPGIVDALELLKAGFDRGRETESPAAFPPAAEDRSLRSFALEALGADTLESAVPETAAIDWVRHGAEVSLLVLQAQTRDATLESAGNDVSAALRAEAPAALRAKLRLTSDEAAPVAAPAVSRTAPQPALPSVAERVRVQRRILAAREAAQRQGSLESAPALEASMPPDAPLPHADDVIHRIDNLIKAMPPGEIGDPQAFRQAVEILRRHGHSALRDLVNLDPNAAAATPSHASALEAIVIADGSRPSFLLRDGLAPLDHPFLGTWASDIKTFRDKMQIVARAVGRVQPTGGHASLFVGTATLVDREKLLALTNYHVLDDARVKLGVPMTQVDRKVTIHGGLEIDFIGEADNLATNRFKVIEAILPKTFGRGFGRVDAALLRIEPVNNRSKLPDAVVKLNADPAFMSGEAERLPSLCTIGFPGPPPQKTGKTGGVDWAFVTTALFGGRFGLKRLAPGSFHHALGGNDLDTLGIVFEHNATTFGGASGSQIIAWQDNGSPCIGLHFAGTTETANWAISVSAAADALREIGVPIA